MCHCHVHGSCLGCSRAISRRGFVKGCGAALAAGCGLGPVRSGADEAKQNKIRIGLVFLARVRNSWPYPGFDVEGRRQEILNLLKDGCPGVEFIPVMVHHPDDVKKAVALKDQVDGYLVHVTTLSWSLTGAITQIAQLGKPALVVDEYLGGSGAFLIGYSRTHRQGIPLAAVSATDPSDLVTVARQFAGIKKPGTTPATFARQCWEVYRKTFPGAGEMKCPDDPVSLTDIGECLKRFKDSRFLIVGRGRPGQVQDFLGAKGIYAGFEELKALYDKVDPEKAAHWAARWSNDAEKVVEPKPEPINKGAAVYLAILELLKKHDTDSITMNCLGGFSAGRLPAYPCLGFMQILNDGGQGVCEAMPDDTLSMMMARLLTGRPGYVSDPVLDTSKRQIVYAHCVGTTKVFGPEGESNKYRIRTLHNRDPRGACIQSFMPSGYMTTSFRTNFARKKMVIHQAKSVGNLDSKRGCRTQLIGEVHGDIGKLFDQWDLFGWHRVTVFGDVKEPLIEFGKGLGLEIVEEA